MDDIKRRRPPQQIVPPEVIYPEVSVNTSGSEAQSQQPIFTYSKPAKKKSKLVFVKKGALILTATLGLMVAVFSIKIVFATNHVITRNISGGAPALAGKIDPTKLKGEGDGRINILLLGVGGVGHNGGSLSDTMMVVSIDPRTKDVAMLSIPRDLWVSISGHGMSKINAANSYGGPELAKSTVSKTLDIPIHYYVLLDFQGFRLAVDQVGGINVTTPIALSDRGYPCDNDGGKACPYYLAAGKHHLNGVEALKYARCREGSCGTNYGREERQRESLLALRERALGISTLTNPSKIASLIDIVGGHLKTDLQIDDMVKLATLGKSIDVNAVVAKGLSDYTHSDMVQGQSVVLPNTRTFTEIRSFVHSILTDSYIKQENAAIDIQNGTTKDGLATSVGVLFRDTYKYNVVSMSTADNQNYPSTILYDYSGGKKPYTIRFLESRLGVKAQKMKPPLDVAVDARIILGADYRSGATAKPE
jgi:polyisoprenyl-teichoic acid--peptidoglycan teichoic acid transferase